MLLPGNYAQRQQLSDEVHARPFAALHPPERATHIALFTGQGDSARARDHDDLAALCRHYGVTPPAAEANHAMLDFDVCRLKWERHAEFCTYTVFLAGPLPADPFADPVWTVLPADWRQRLPDCLITAVNVAIAPSGRRTPPERVAQLMGSANFAAAWVSGGAAFAFMDFAIDPAGFGHLFIQDKGMRPRQAGRLVQRLLEIETYRMMALIGLPLAREQAGQLRALEEELTRTTAGMAELDGVDAERRTLVELTAIAERLESATGDSTYRFQATRAYYDIVQRRIADLREERIEGFQTFTEFVERRLAPAMNTCQAVRERCDQLAADLGRAGQLLHTRVTVQVEAQNRDLLDSMDRRSNLQIRLQETVESLSIAAATYYLVGLVDYGAKALKATGLAVPVPQVAGIAIPIVAGLVWFVIRRIRRHIHKHAGRPG